MEMHARTEACRRHMCCIYKYHLRLWSLVSVPVMFGKSANWAALQQCLQQLRSCHALQSVARNCQARSDCEQVHSSLQSCTAAQAKLAKLFRNGVMSLVVARHPSPSPSLVITAALSSEHFPSSNTSCLSLKHSC